MKINKNNIDVHLSPQTFCGSCAFFYKQSPACLTMIIHSYLPCGGELTYTTSEIFEL